MNAPAVDHIESDVVDRKLDTRRIQGMISSGEATQALFPIGNGHRLSRLGTGKPLCLSLRGFAQFTTLAPFFHTVGKNGLF